MQRGVAHNPFRDPRKASQTSLLSANSARSISQQFALGPDPAAWGLFTSQHGKEADDYLHEPDKKMDKRGTIFTARGIANVGCLVILACALVALFAGYPITSYVLRHRMSTLGAYNLGGINATGQVMETVFALIDKDTPQDAYTYKSLEDGNDWQLVFSDEFNQDGRTFYPGEDPYWEAVDLHYWGTSNLEWYDPQQIITEGGALRILLEKVQNHELDYRGGMMSTWNKFCFTGGIMVASVTLPGKHSVSGLWPAVWSMGNLGRAGYGASLEGMWPYTYEACDIGALPNQTYPDKSGPDNALTGGDKNGPLSFLPGQRLSSCTCPGEAHPGPVKKDGTYIGRAAPEIDMFEAQVSDALGEVSQSAQWAPYDGSYRWNNLTYANINDPEVSRLNSFAGSIYQQATSIITKTNQGCYDQGEKCFALYGFEYKPGYEEDGAYISWINDGKFSWRLGAGGVGKNDITEISARPIPKEPMYILLNLGISEGFAFVDSENLEFPTTMSIDYIRVYQHPDRVNIGCDPPGYPTNNYINAFIEAYTNPNITTWEGSPERGGYQQETPRNRLLGEC